MKKVVTGENLKNKMQEGINLLCDTVKSTLGPKGSNIIIDHSTFSPFITNDGVTIASNIESEDEVINTILEIAKESCLKTNDMVGDGTTTTLVLLQSIFNSGLQLIKEGINPIILKKELDKVTKKVVEMIREKSRIPDKEEMKYIAHISSNDEEIGSVISKVFLEVLEKRAINIKETDSNITKVNYLKGYTFDSLLASSYFLEGLKEKEYYNPYILLINNSLNDINDIDNIINHIIKENKSLIIIATDFTDYFVEEILGLNLENKLNILLLKTPEYGLRQLSVLEDLSVICKAKVVNKLDNINLNYLGNIDDAIATNETITFNFKFNDLIKSRILKLRTDLLNTETEKEFIEKRLSMFDKGTAEILVGAQTTTERREKKMRFDDALWAISSASKGVVPGSGLILSQVSEELDDESIGSKILKIALLKPLEQIMYNAGLDYEVVFNKIRNENFEIIYNITNSKYESVNNTKVLDPTEVVINTLNNAASIAGMLLTTTSIVINECQNNLNKVNDYNEL